MDVNTFKITNIKLSLKTTFILLDTVKRSLKTKQIDFKEYPNYIVIKNIFTYVFFKSGDNSELNHLNITNIKSFERIDKAVDHFFEVLLQGLQIFEVYRRVDNISASLNLNLKINLLNVVDFFKNICCVSYNTEKFPGVFLKFDKGTVIIFHTGKCIFIGCKNISGLKCLRENIQMFVNTKIKS